MINYYQGNRRELQSLQTQQRKTLNRHTCVHASGGTLFTDSGMPVFKKQAHVQQKANP